jgi:hypothetical protein
VAQHTLPLGGFDHEVPAVRTHHQAGVQLQLRSVGIEAQRIDPGCTGEVVARHAGFGDSAARRSPAGGCE